MNTALLVSALALCGASAPTPPPLDTAIAAAKGAGRPLVIELYTSWCEPCKVFEDEMLPDPAVQRALRDVSLIRYDAEKGPGVAAEARFGGTGFPTFVVIDGSGAARLRQAGLSSKEELIAFLERATTAVLTEPQLLAHVQARPGAPTQLVAARWYVSRGRTVEALPYFERAEQADLDGKLGVGADAAWERAGADRRLRTARELAAFVARHPRSPHAGAAIELAAPSGELPPEEARKLVAAIVAAHLDDAGGLSLALDPALAAGALDDAEHAAKRLLQLQPDDTAFTHDALAQVAHARGDKKAALAAADRAIKAAGDDEDLRDLLAGRRALYARGGGDAPGAAAARRAAEGFFSQLAAPAAEDIGPGAPGASGPPPDIAETMAYLETISRAFAGVSARCAGEAGSLTEAWVRVELADAPGPPRSVVVLEPDASPALKQCLAAELTKSEMSAARKSDANVTVNGAIAGGPRHTGPVTFVRERR